MRDKIIKIIEEAGDLDGIPGLYTIEEAVDAIMALTGNGMKWEYEMLSGRIYLADVNVMGEQGWELVAADQRCLLFKRPKEDDGKQETAFKEEPDEKDEGESEGSTLWCQRFGTVVSECGPKCSSYDPTNAFCAGRHNHSGPRLS